MDVLRFLLLAALGWMISCGGKQSSSDDGLGLKSVRMPGGQVVMAEVMFRRQDVMTGMMFRNSLPENRALLFVHNRMGKYGYWMHNVRVPLDIVWVDKDRKIVEISANTPPCPEKDPTRCPSYGGKKEAQFVVELAAGVAAKFGLEVGQSLEF